MRFSPVVLNSGISYCDLKAGPSPPWLLIFQGRVVFRAPHEQWGWVAQTEKETLLGQQVFNQEKQRAQQRNVFGLQSVLNTQKESGLKPCEVKEFFCQVQRVFWIRFQVQFVSCFSLVVVSVFLFSSFFFFLNNE